MVSLFVKFYIPKNLVIKGDVDSPFSCSVNGRVEGSVHSIKTVRIKKDGEILGNVFAKKAKIEGTVWGDVHVSELEVMPGGHVKGKIMANLVRVHENGMVEDVEEVQAASNKVAPKTDKLTWF